MFNWFCGVCWAALLMTGLVLFGMLVVFVLCLFAGSWSIALWLGVAIVVYSGMLFTVAYFEARGHWKRGSREFY